MTEIAIHSLEHIAGGAGPASTDPWDDPANVFYSPDLETRARRKAAWRGMDNGLNAVQRVWPKAPAWVNEIAMDIGERRELRKLGRGP